MRIRTHFPPLGSCPLGGTVNHSKLPSCLIVNPRRCGTNVNHALLKISESLKKSLKKVALKLAEK